MSRVLGFYMLGPIMGSSHGDCVGRLRKLHRGYTLAPGDVVVFYNFQDVPGGKADTNNDRPFIPGEELFTQIAVLRLKGQTQDIEITEEDIKRLEEL